MIWRVRPKTWGLVRALSAADTFDLVVALTLVLLLLYSGGSALLRLPVVLMCALAIALPNLGRTSTFWLIVSLPISWSIVLDWAVVDNHKYLTVYWCLALASCAESRDVEVAMRRNARLLIGLTFLMATFWKLLSSDYLSSGFFEYTLLTDPRFEWVAHVLGRMGVVEAAHNMVRVGDLVSHPEAIGAVTLARSQEIRLLARVLTWWTLAVEGMIALSFLAPSRSRLGRSGDVLLLGFGFSSYAVASVVGFGWLLMVMGIAQADRSRSWARPAYLSAFIAIRLYLAPWAQTVHAVAIVLRLSPMTPAS